MSHCTYFVLILLHFRLEHWFWFPCFLIRKSTIFFPCRYHWIFVRSEKPSFPSCDFTGCCVNGMQVYLVAFEDAWCYFLVAVQVSKGCCFIIQLNIMKILNINSIKYNDRVWEYKWTFQIPETPNYTNIKFLLLFVMPIGWHWLLLSTDVLCPRGSTAQYFKFSRAFSETGDLVHSVWSMVCSLLQANKTAASSW